MVSVVGTLVCGKPTCKQLSLSIFVSQVDRARCTLPHQLVTVGEMLGRGGRQTGVN